MATLKQRWYFSAHRTFLRHFMGHHHHHRTFLVTTFVVLAALLSWQYCGTRYAGWTPAKFWRLGLLIDTPGCQLAAHDPFDHSMQKRYYKDTWRNETLCQDPDDPVKFVRYDVPELNGPLLQRRYGMSAEDVHCQYSPLTRNLTAAIPDLNAVYGAPRPVVFGEPIPDEYILLWCNAGKKKLFSQHYFLPKRRNTKPLSREQIGVVVIGLDSVSRSNSFRQLPRTRQFMKERGAFEMLGYNKVGENTMPNVIPLLTGMSGDLVRTRYKRRNFDGLPHLMAVYKKKGFPTIYQDECPNSGVFVYVGGMGFRGAPSDYYPYFGSIVPPALSPCAALKYFSDVVTLNKKMFAWLWLMNMTHEDINDAGYLDLPLESTLRSLAASGIMENNALLVMADHGARYGDYRLTDLGDYEDKLPVCLLALPQRFLHQYPEAAANLEVNQRRLVTTYDLHATLLALSTLPRFHSRPTDRGLSLFQRVPPERTCADASILPQFCACDGEETSVTELLDVKSYLAFSVVDYVNDLLRTTFPGKCVVWKLAQAGPVKVRRVNASSLHLFEFWFETEPLPVAKFYVHGWLQDKSIWSGRTVEQLERVDTYGPGSRCLPSTLESKFCRCKPELLESRQTTDSHPVEP